MDIKLQVVCLLLLSLLLIEENAAVTGTWVPGVAKGDYFTYEMYGVFTSNRSNTTIAIPQFEYNNTQWVKINITNIEDSVIEQVYVLHFKNQSETELDFKTDVNPAIENNGSGQSVPICAANQGAGDIVPAAGLIINETVSRSYAGGLRETNHANWSSSDDWGNCYFDKETGMLVEFHRTHRFTNSATDEVVEKTDVINLISTNRWEISANSSQTTLFIVILGSIIFALLFLTAMTYSFFIRKTRNPQTQQKPQITDKYTLHLLSAQARALCRMLCLSLKFTSHIG